MSLSLLPLLLISFAVTAFNRAAAENASPHASEMVEIPAGKFIMGSNIVDPDENWKKYGSRAPWFLNEHPARELHIDRYFIDIFEVTNKSYLQFVKKIGYKLPRHWLENGYAFQLRPEKIKQLPLGALRDIAANVFKLDVDTRQLNREQLLDAINGRWTYLDNLPVTHVSFYDAQAYCTSLSKRLPTEAEWEKAARGGDGRDFVFGNEWHMGWSNVGEEYWEEGPAPVGSYPRDKSVYGVYDLAGNVYEWVADWYQSYPGSDYNHPDFGRKYKVVRGSGFGKDGHYFLIHYQRAAYRSRLFPDDIKPGQGFRCAADRQ